MTSVTSVSRPPTLPDDEAWWRQAVVYQIYPRSFADHDGDGLGDLVGIRSRVSYLADLGIDAVWLSPFYPSALADGGYDVDDYRNVDPRLGTLADFDDLLEALHRAGIRLVVDIVPNHTSNRHAWFREALASPRGSAARARYHFRDGLGEHGELPPSDWRSFFGGPAWEPVGDGQWYLHFFAKEQPDLNWANREVRDDFLRTLRFWSDRGVDGFRIDVAHMLAKRLDDPLPTQAELDALPVTGDHPVLDRDEVQDIYREWRQVFNEYRPARTAVAEAWVAPERRPRYASPQGLGQAFNFDLLQADFDAAQFRSVIESNLRLAAASGSSSTWVLSNHDVVRHATRYGLAAGRLDTIRQGREWLLRGGSPEEVDSALGLHRARAATLLMLALPGAAYLYQGEELGLGEVGDIDAARREDPTYFRNPGVDVGRDGCRVPLPWRREGGSFGFGPDGAAHLPQPDYFGRFSVEVELADPTSTLVLYRRALRLRHDLETDEVLEWLPSPADVVAFRRPGGWVSITNFGPTPVNLPEGRLLLTSSPLERGRLAGNATAWLRQ